MLFRREERFPMKPNDAYRLLVEAVDNRERPLGHLCSRCGVPFETVKLENDDEVKRCPRCGQVVAKE